jgi:hypothetical protein
MDDDKFHVPNRLEIKPGAFYFVAKCPNTKKILAIERDPDRGSNPYSHADTLVSCHHCQGRHRFERPILSLVKPARGTIGESQGPGSLRACCALLGPWWMVRFVP